MFSVVINEYIVDRTEAILGSWGEVKVRVHSLLKTGAESGSHV